MKLTSEFVTKIAEKIVDNRINANYWYADLEKEHIGTARETSENAVPVNELIEGYVDPSPFPIWNDEAGNLPNFRSMVEHYLEENGEEFEENGDIPDWVDFGEVIDSVRELPQFSNTIKDYEKASYEATIVMLETEIRSFIKDEYQ